MLLSVLACGLTKHEYAWQPFTILVGPPGGGKSEGIGNVADCLPGSMVRHATRGVLCEYKLIGFLKGTARGQQQPVCGSGAGAGGRHDVPSTYV